ncbi:LuxR C-terminal-related transcriptional regulator [Nocardia sp. CA-135398]|uniref:LuxR C-terminal-related transcriptional regulator n=1 Tax=Nocardia sp. CA-135398 TaxID=3239977 RepID=UPI003D99BA43
MVDHRSARPPRPPSGNYRLPSLIGRDAERAEIARLLTDPQVRLLTLTGTAGVGKSRLAREVLADGPFRTCLDAVADLGEVVDRAGAWHAVLDASGQRPLGTVERPRTDARTALTILAARIGTCRAILLLDNCDHVAAELSTDVAWLLGRCPHLVCVTTSRVPLHLYRECVLCIAPLSTGDGNGEYYPASSPGAQLLLASIDSHYRAAAAVADRLVLDEIVRALDGVPLALELAATSISRLGPVGTLQRIAAGVDLPESTFVDPPARHRTMHAAVAWGLVDLDGAALDLLLRLSLCESTIDAEIACLLGAGDQERIGAALAELVDRSLLHHAVLESGGIGYRFVSTVRAYCRTALRVDVQRAEGIRREHVDRICELAEVLGARMHRPEHRADALALAGTHLRDVLAVLRQLIATGEGERAIRAAAALHCAWIQHGYLIELETVLADALASGDRGLGSPGETAPRCLELLGHLALCSGRTVRAVGILTNAVAAYERFDNIVGAGRCAVLLAVALRGCGDHDAAGRALATARSADLPMPWSRWLDIGAALLDIPNPPRLDDTTWSQLRDRLRQCDTPIQLDGLLMLARTQLGADTAARAQELYREVLEHDELASHVLCAIIALEGCARAYDSAGVCDTEAATLTVAARHLRAAHGIPQSDRDQRRKEYRNALGETGFREATQSGAGMSLADAVAYARTAPTLTMPVESPLDALTNRQREIAELVATGMTNRMIATQLRISEWTVVNHVRQVMLKLDCPSRLHVALVVERGPNSPEQPTHAVSPARRSIPR